MTNTAGYGGSEKHVLELIAGLEGSVRSVILCAGANPYSERLEASRYLRVEVRSASLRSLADWVRIFLGVRPDVAVFVYGTLTAIPWDGVLAARLAGIRKLYSIQHSVPPPARSEVEGRPLRNVAYRVIGGWARLSAYLCDGTICVSNAIRETLVAEYRFQAHKTITIYNGVSLKQFTPDRTPDAVERHAIRAKLGITPEELVLVCSARLSEEKRIGIVLTAMKRLLSIGLECKSIILGDGHLKESLMAQVGHLGLSSHVWLEGFQENVRPYLRASDIFVLTSQREGLSYSVLEAMACGLPCVVTGGDGKAEAVSHNLDGMVVWATPDKVAEAISYLWTHPAERARMSCAARAKVCEHFDIEYQMAETQRVLFGQGGPPCNHLFAALMELISVARTR